MKLDASNRALRHRTGSADLPRPAKDSQTAEALAGSRVASWRRRAYRRWGISPRPEDVLLWWIAGGIRRRDSSIRAAAGRRDGAFRRWRRRLEHGRRLLLTRGELTENEQAGAKTRP